MALQYKLNDHIIFKKKKKIKFKQYKFRSSFSINTCFESKIMKYATTVNKKDKFLRL